jgi:phage shock protein C
MGSEFPPPSRPPAPADRPPEPPHARRLTRSSRERLWAGVAGGMAEYFDLDPSLVRLLWVVAALVSHGLAVPVYILLWFLLPRDDRPPQWRDWSHEFHSETQRIAEEARRHRSSTAPDAPAPGTYVSDPPLTSTYEAPPPQTWSDPHPQRHHGRSPRALGVLFVGLGVLLLAANEGFFTWINPNTLWPVLVIGLGVALLARQAGWR